MPLRALLKSKGYKLNDLANSLGISISTLNRILRKKIIPRLDIAIKIEELTNGEIKHCDLMDFCLVPKSNYNSSEDQKNI